MVYTITYQNIGTEMSCANTLTIDLDDNLERDANFHNLEKIVFEDVD